MRPESAIKVLKRLRLLFPLMGDEFKAIETAINALEEKIKREKEHGAD